MAIKRIPVSEPCLGKNELKYVTDCVRSGWISSLGSYITEFEKKFSGFCGMPYGVTTSNGTTALHLALEILGIKTGDEVIVPSLTFIAVANAVKYSGAKPVFADSEYSTWNIDPKNIEKLITKNTKAIIAVHSYGHPADIGSIKKIADKHKLFLIEDCAESHGALYRGKMTGSFGDISCFSFYGNKIITTGEGGILLTRSSKLYEKAKFLRDHGMSKKRRYFHPEIGFNYRITNLQCAVGLGQFERINYLIDKRREHAYYYNELLATVEELTLPPEEIWAKNVFWMYSILTLKRDALAQHLSKNGIDSRPFFIPIHKQPPYMDKKLSLPVSEDLARQGMNLPSSARLSKTDIRRICETIRYFFKNNQR